MNTKGKNCLSLSKCETRYLPKTAFTNFSHQVTLGTDAAVSHKSTNKEHNLGEVVSSILQNI